MNNNFNLGFKKLSRNLDGKQPKAKNIVVEYVSALFTAVVLAFVIRSFIVEPFKIPSKSMVPTLLVGDHIFVNKFAYGLRIPLTFKWITKFAEPKRGEVIVFIEPRKEKEEYIKRVVGVPGDHIEMKDGHLFVNGDEITEQEIEVRGVSPDDKRQLVAATDSLPPFLKKVPYFDGYDSFRFYKESLFDQEHFMQRSRFFPQNENGEWFVPADNYFVMGDNRDQSEDSRVWKFVPRDHLVGKAMFIWLSLDKDLGGVRWKRFGKRII